MPVGFVLGSFLSLFLAYGPAILIAFSSRASGWQKAKWVLIALLPPILMGAVGFIAMLLLIRQDPKLLMTLSPAFNILGYAGAWGAYLLFRKRAVALP